MANGSIGLDEALNDYLVQAGVREHPVLTDLRRETANLPNAGMQIAPEEGAFLAMLVRLLPARRILEVGTFTGYSSTAMALALADGGRVTCCDVSREWTDVARRAFIDADKASYDAYYERALQLVRSGGLIAIDNVLWSGRVADDSVQDDDTKAIRALNAKIAADERVDVVMVPIADGV